MRKIYVTNVPPGASLSYTLYLNGTAIGAAVSSGITAVGSGTGVYEATVDDTTCDFVIWDKGSGSVQYRYADEQILPLVGATVTPILNQQEAVTPIIGGGPATFITPIIG